MTQAQELALQSARDYDDNATLTECSDGSWYVEANGLVEIYSEAGDLLGRLRA